MSFGVLGSDLLNRRLISEANTGAGA
jgi:hypothetical protein